MAKISFLPDKIIEYSFYLLFFLVPLILTPWNYELFEYNKMILTYALTIIIVGAWLIKSVTQGKFSLQRTPLDLPILIFLTSQILSFIFSIDRHVSLWGYYSRFNGGLLSTVSYILLYYAFVTNFPKEKLRKLFSFIFASGLLAAFYGILEHFGIDKNIWVQDVQNRVFSTLGQPNWLAAYLAILLPITMAFSLISKTQIKNEKILNFALYFCILLFYLCLLFTKSRSGFLGFWLSNTLFWLLIFLAFTKNYRNLSPIGSKFQYFFLVFNLSFLLLTFIFGAPFPQINRAALPELIKSKTSVKPAESVKPSSPELKISESSEIRNIVWRGAWKVFRHYPLLGSGVETFAFSYYQYRPKEHNLTSEWDFLYNKAHNEYLNYLATTGFVGLGSYILLIGTFLWWSLKNIKNQSFDFAQDKISKIKTKLKVQSTLHFALLAGWLSILVTNFFGFSVVIVNIFFFLIPAISFMLLSPPPQGVNRVTPLRCNRSYTLGIWQRIALFIILFAVSCLLFVVLRLWYADTLFNRGHSFFEAQEFQEAYEPTKQAVNLFPSEPLYRNQYSQILANLSLLAYEANEATLSQTLTNQALEESGRAIKTSPFNVNFWKSRTKVFYTLGQIEENFNQKAIDSLLTTQKLSPTDPKIPYNLGLLYFQEEDDKAAIASLLEAIELKPDYREAHFALSLFYKESGSLDKAKNELKYILEKINPMDEEAKKKLEEWR